VLNRGNSSRPAPPGVVHLRGDRGDLDVLAAAAAEPGGWHAVVDTCAYLAWQVRLAADVLRPKRYVLISSISVYRSFSDSDQLVEDAECVDPEYPERITGATYSGGKRACELALTDAGVPSLVVRCGLMTGPDDIASTRRYPSRGGPPGGTELDYDSFAGRLPYWPWRMARGGAVVVPGKATGHRTVAGRVCAGWAVRRDERGRRAAHDARLGRCLRTALAGREAGMGAGQRAASARPRPPATAALESGGRR
jgi:2'-hydroxyisoflavone reductase